MQFKQYTRRIILRIKGRLPTTVFIWHIMLAIMVIVTIGLITNSYISAYKVVHSAEVMQTDSGEYEPMLDTQKLNAVLGAYGG